MTAWSDARRRKGVIGAVLVFLGLPLALALAEAVRFHIANRDTGTIVSAGETREYLLHVPRGYDRSKPAPLVISMHGAALWGAAQMRISQWNGVADREGIIVVYPSGVPWSGAAALARGRRPPGAGRPIHRGVDRHIASQLQH